MAARVTSNQRHDDAKFVPSLVLVHGADLDVGKRIPGKNKRSYRDANKNTKQPCSCLLKRFDAVLTTSVAIEQYHILVVSSLHINMLFDNLELMSVWRYHSDGVCIKTGLDQRMRDGRNNGGFLFVVHIAA